MSDAVGQLEFSILKMTNTCMVTIATTGHMIAPWWLAMEPELFSSFLGFPDFCVLKKKMKLCAEGHVTLLFCILFVTSHQMSINIVRRKLPSQFTMSSRPYPIIPQSGSFPASWIIVCYGNVMVL